MSDIPQKSAKRIPWREVAVLSALVALFLALRIGILLTDVSKYVHEDELSLGVTAKDLLEDRCLRFLDYKSDQHTGGVLLMVPLTACFFAALGDSLVVLKLVALAFGLGAMIAWYLFCRAFFGRRAALFVALLHVVAPPGYTMLSLMTLGNHCQANLFTAVFLYLFYSLYYRADRQRPRHPRLRYALLGFVAGFSLWFYYGSLVMLAAAGLAAIWRIGLRRGEGALRDAARGIWPFAIGFLAGFSPWFADGVAHQFEGLNVFERPLHEHFFRMDFLTTLERAWAFVTIDLRRSFFFGRAFGLPGELFSWVLYVAIVVAVLSAAVRIAGRGRRGAEESELPLLLFLLLYTLIWTLTDFPVGTQTESPLEFRYLMPMFPFLFVLIAVSLAKLPDGWQLPPALCGSALLCASLVALTDFHRLGATLPYRGYSYERLGALIGWRYGHDVDECLRLAAKLERPRRPSVYWGMGFLLWERSFAAGSKAERRRELDRLREELPEQDFFYLCGGFGGWAGGQWRHQQNPGAVDYLIDEAEILAERERQWFFRGAGYECMRAQFPSDQWYFALQQLGRRMGKDFCFGMGWGLSREYLHRGKGIKAVLASPGIIQEEYWPVLVEGIGWGVGWQPAGRRLGAVFRKQVPERYWSCYDTGLGAVLSELESRRLRHVSR